MNKTILLVEDSEDDVFFMRRALRLAGIDCPVQVAVDGQSAIDYLDGKGEYADRTAHPWPSLVLLDLRLPLVPGLDVLRWIRNQPGFACLPVIVLTSSNQETDMQQAYALGANSFLVKPSEATDLVQMVKAISEYWLRLNAAPATCPGPALERGSTALGARDAVSGSFRI